MLNIIHIAQSNIIDTIVNNNYRCHRIYGFFYSTNIDNEFLSLLKLKFGNDAIRTYSEICKNPRLAYQYANYVLNGRFEDGEEAIAVDKYASIDYAIDVIKGRFPAAEIYLHKDSRFFDLYSGILLQRFDIKI